MAEVPLVDLEVIVRYSLAIRQEMAPAEEVLAALDESRALVLALLDGEQPNNNGVEPEGEADEEAAFHSSPPGEGGQGDDVVEIVDPERPGEAEDAGPEVAAADEVALDGLAGSDADVDPAPREVEPEVARPPAARASRMGTRSRRPPPETPAPRPAPPAEPDDDEDQAWTDEVERIRQRRINKARLEAEERQVRQADLAVKARQARRAEEARVAEDAREELEAKQRQQELRARRGTRAKAVAAPPAAPAPRPGRTPSSGAGPGRDDLDDGLELPPPLPADEAARRRAERRKRRSES